MVLGLSAAARLAAAMLTAPASRSAVVTRLRMAARTAGALPVRARWASSPKVMSRTQWMLFSMDQWPAPHLLAACTHPADRVPAVVLAQRAIPGKTNEIPMVQR